MNTATINQMIETAQKELAAGVLNQAVYDLRRYRSANSKVGQEVYLDVYRWITANDFSWPFSFLNVCKSLGLMPEVVRGGLLGDPSPGWFGYCRKICGRINRGLQSSFVAVVTEGCSSQAPEPNGSIPAS